MIRDQRISFWVSGSEKQQIQQMAKKHYLNLSEYLRLSSQGFLCDVEVPSTENLQPILEDLKNEIKSIREIITVKQEQTSNPFARQIIDSLLQFWEQHKPNSFDEAQETIEYEFQKNYVFDAILEAEKRNLARISIEKEWIKWNKKK